ncbi:MAG TPA: Spy/CpxP family protein refolding chaperone [Terriglobales bacterium]
MKTKLMVVASVLALLLCGATIFAYAQGPGGEGFGGPGHGHMGFLARELNLTDAQKAQVKTIIQANSAIVLTDGTKTSVKAVMQQMAQNRAAMLAATANGAYDQQTQLKIQSLATQQAQLEAAMVVNRESIRHQIYTQVLTADQQAKAEQLRTQEINRINERLQKMATGTEAAPTSNQ